MLWIPITAGAAALQVARNALQRGLLASAGPWGATLVRFLFGVPFSVAFALIAAAVFPSAHPQASVRFFVACALGSATQIGATAAMLVSMRRSSFALGSAFQQSSILLAALGGLFLGDRLSALRWVGLVLTAGGLTSLAWPRHGNKSWSAAGLGLLAGAGFAISSNAFRAAALSLDARHPVLAAQITLVTAQCVQSLALLAWLVARDRAALAATCADWRASISAGFFGAAASSLWFTAFAMSPAGPVRAVGVVELPLAALAGRRLFAERLGFWQIIAAGVAAVGVAMAAL